MEIVKVEPSEALVIMQRGEAVYVLEHETYQKHRNARPQTNVFHRMMLRKVNTMKIDDIVRLIADHSYFCMIEGDD